ncbi:MAG: hypothetical protein COW13_01250 [Candidatus Omnitrophica bacterium CG12_big_fil_rev_8_21_14_0_65_50_5]|nr:MAG: hypothetical protein COV46_02945 [Deltaproteobacteria bacterium CG11_big_fil_rev_8_21_14_0_20_49_13]PIW64114.1 MAG: hypothetical protein COW13_01250 [Candidatus Omnitrophica bacterium CG12_big_fil_rev_8_21_14_0_65_50_5]
MKWNAANILTLSRLLLVPVFLVCFILKLYSVAFFAFAIASFTDLIDGTVARILRQNSQFGALLDPIADKLLMITAFSCLVSVRYIPSWFLILVILRDVMIMSGIGVLKILKIHVEYKPFISSKFATLGQILLGVLSLATLYRPEFALGVYPLGDFAEGTMYITSILLIVSALQYIQKGLYILQKGEEGGYSRKYRSKAV